jgi:hypothetical protein
MTLDRLATFIRRCAKKTKRNDQHGKMRELLNDRYRYHFTNSSNDSDLFWNKDIVLAMIQGRYFTEQYDYDKMVCLVKKYDDGNALQMGYQWFKNIEGNYRRDYLLQLKSCFTPDYLQQRLEEGYYLEILTLVSLRIFPLPISLTKNQKRNLRKCLFKVLMIGYYETNVNSAESYQKERITRAKTLFAQYPDLFTFKDILTVMLSSPDLGVDLYSHMNPGHKTLTQKTIGKLLDDGLLCRPMLFSIVLYDIPLDENNMKKVYAWIKKTMASHGDKVNYCNLSGSDKRTVQIFIGLCNKFNITLAFDDFLDVLVSVGDTSVWKENNICGYNEERLMNNFFSVYRNDLSRLCNYAYRSQLKDKSKQKLVLDLFFWKYLPWNSLHTSEKIVLNDFLDVYAERYPERVLLLAQKHPSIITLTNDTKLTIFLSLARPQKNEIRVYAPFDFGSGIDNQIILSPYHFKNLVKNNIDGLYSLIHLPQINAAAALNTISQSQKFDAWWAESVYLLILLENSKYIPTKAEAMELLTVFADDRILKIPHNYFACLWNALPDDRKPDPLDLCVLNNTRSCEEPLFDVFRQLLYNNLIVLDDVLIARLIALYAKDIHSNYIDQIAKSNITNATELLSQIRHYKVESLLS